MPPAMPHSLRRLRPGTPTCRAWLWALAALLLLKAAMPLLAAWSAHDRGVALVEVCSVYGVRTVAADGPAEPAANHPAADGPCALASLLGPWAPLPTAAQPHIPAPDVSAGPAPHLRHPARPDASRRWLTSRLHAPPPTA